MKETIQAMREAQRQAAEAERIRKVAVRLRDEALADAVQLRSNLPKAMIVPSFALFTDKGFSNFSAEFHRDRLIDRVTEPNYEAEKEGRFL